MKSIYTFLFLAGLLISHIGTAQCVDDTHSPFADQAWLSCATTESPNSIRGNGHWIQYDLGHLYTLDSLYYWNYNAWSETGFGAREVVLDYSEDGVNWFEADTFLFEKAPGSWQYTGSAGPKLNNITGRYFLFTVLNTWDEFSTCAGLGELKFVLGKTTSIKNPENTLSFNVTPNPASRYIDITIPENIAVEAVSLYTATGQKVAEQISPQQEVVEFDVSGLPDGIYFVHLFTADEVGTRSIVKME